MSRWLKLFWSMEGKMKRMKRFRQIVLVSLGVGLLVVPVLGKPKPSYQLGTIEGDIASEDAVPIDDFTFVDGLWLSSDLLRASTERIDQYRDNDPDDTDMGWRSNVVDKPAPTGFPSQIEDGDYSFYSGHLRVLWKENKPGARIDFLFSPCGACEVPLWNGEDSPPVGVDPDTGEPVFFFEEDGTLNCEGLD